MIFVTVGYQMSFDRMVKAVDEWAKRNPGVEIFAQIGPTDFVPQNMPHTRFLSPDEFRIRIEEATLLVAHAGMGSILTAMEMQKPIVIMPRRGDLQETRNDHQIATLKKMAGRLDLVAAGAPRASAYAWKRSCWLASTAFPEGVLHPRAKEARVFGAIKSDLLIEEEEKEAQAQIVD